MDKVILPSLQIWLGVSSKGEGTEAEDEDEECAVVSQDGSCPSLVRDACNEEVDDAGEGMSAAKMWKRFVTPRMLWRTERSENLSSSWSLWQRCQKDSKKELRLRG